MGRESAKRLSAIPVVSLFSGPGGLDLGFHDAGFSSIFAADFDSSSVETYNHNLPPVAQRKDLAAVDPKEILEAISATGKVPRGVIGGPPCQSFSQANVRQRRNDPRKKLIFSFASLVKAIDAKFDIDFFLMENVAALAKPKHRRILGRLKTAFRSSGFTVYQRVMNAAEFGVPQKRQRLFLVGIKHDIAGFARFQFPEPQKDRKTVRQAIGHLGEPVFFDRAKPKRRIPFHRNHWTMFPRSDKFGVASKQQGRSFQRLQWNKPSRAVAYGHREIHVHPSGRRRLSILEAMLLQGFPQRYRLSGNLSEQVTQVSNAVPPPLARSIALSIQHSIYRRRKKAQLRLLRAHQQHGRSFPWRQSSSTFHLLVAEKLLQQTAAGQNVVRAYEQLIKTWPTATAMAAAPLAEIQRIIRPLGFKYRASELIALSATLERKYKGDVPLNSDALMALPGVGEYTTNAVLSFSGTKQTAVVDTNVSRLLFRLLGLDGAAPSNPARHPRLQRLANWLIAGQDARAMNYAVLDLTADVCGARKRACPTCPLNHWCVSREPLRPAV